MDIERLKKIDFSKCKLEPIGDLRLRIIADEDVIAICNVTSNIITSLREIDGNWQIRTGATGMGHCDVLELFERGDVVDRFIASELARMEADEDAANWTVVHWRDVEWLTDRGAAVQIRAHYTGRWDPISRGCQAFPSEFYRADKRTFPVGYDPEKPRWVEVDRDQVARLEHSGAVSAWRNGNVWKERLKQDRGLTYDFTDYAVDIHTLPNGVPLHVESPKPEPRPCSKAFAMAHPEYSEYRYRFDSGEPWSLWNKMRVFGNSPNSYEFRTTAPPEKRTMDGKEFLRYLLDNPGKHMANGRDGAACDYEFNDGLRAGHRSGGMPIYPLPSLLHNAPYEVNVT